MLTGASSDFEGQAVGGEAGLQDREDGIAVAGGGGGGSGTRGSWHGVIVNRPGSYAKPVVLTAHAALAIGQTSKTERD